MQNFTSIIRVDTPWGEGSIETKDIQAVNDAAAATRVDKICEQLNDIGRPHLFFYPDTVTSEDGTVTNIEL